MFICLLLCGCNKSPESVNLEGKSDNWHVFAIIPHAEENVDKYIKVTFICNSEEYLFSESDIISFAIGTTDSSTVYSYSKTDGYIRNEYSSDPADLKRVTRISDNTFEVLYDANVIGISKEDSEQFIVAYAAGEKVELSPVDS